MTVERKSRTVSAESDAGRLGPFGRWKIDSVPDAIASSDKTILRELAAKKAKIAALPIQGERAEMWRCMNDLKPVKPMVWMTEQPWHELNADGRLTLHTRTEFCREIEQDLRRTLYAWENTQGDMIVEPVMYSPTVVLDSGFGIAEDVDIRITDAASEIVSREFHPQIRSESDVDLIQKSEVRIDEDATEATYRALVDIFDPEMPVVRRGVPGFWFAPWDVLVRWTGIEEALVDLSDRPDYIHAAMDRLVEVLLDRLDQCERLGVVALNSTNVRIGSGAYGYSSEVPGDDFDSGSIRTADLWGSATAQIFGVVSPRMHEEFALRYEKKWMERFGLNYYGCCEPLHDKIDILEEVPNLRKISMSPWADLDVATSKMGDRHVYSVKLNPACVAEEGWDAEHVRSDLREKLAILDGCAVEIVLKDISTVKGDPQRLWEWAAIASEVAAEYAS